MSHTKKGKSDKDSKGKQPLVQVPEHDLPGRIMAPPPFELDASWLVEPYNQKRDEEEEEVAEKEEGEKE
jgi:hypothetical protein